METIIIMETIITIIIFGIAIFMIFISAKRIGYYKAKSEAAKQLHKFMDKIVQAHREGKIESFSVKEIIKIMDEVYISKWRIEALKNKRGKKKIPVEH